MQKAYYEAWNDVSCDVVMFARGPVAGGPQISGKSDWAATAALRSQSNSTHDLTRTLPCIQLSSAKHFHFLLNTTYRVSGAYPKYENSLNPFSSSHKRPILQQSLRQNIHF